MTTTNAAPRFSLLSGIQQEAAVLRFLVRCGRGGLHTQWKAAARLDAANTLKSATRDRATASEAARLGMADVAKEARQDAADQEAFATEVLAACDYYAL